MFLYDSILVKKCPANLEDLEAYPAHIVSDFLKTVKGLDAETHEKIYALIRYHHIITEGVVSDTPYGMKKMANAALKIDFNQCPLKLQYILVEFIHLHLASLSPK